MGEGPRVIKGNVAAAEYCGINKSTLQTLKRVGDFPKGVRLNNRDRGYDKSEVVSLDVV